MSFFGNAWRIQAAPLTLITGLPAPVCSEPGQCVSMGRIGPIGRIRRIRPTGGALHCDNRNSELGPRFLPLRAVRRVIGLHKGTGEDRLIRPIRRVRPIGRFLLWRSAILAAARRSV
jgi:hypothetical protein